MDKDEKALMLKFKREKQNQERLAIKALIQAKKTRINNTRQASINALEELTEAMYRQSKRVLPDALDGALKGNVAKSAKNALTELSKPTFKTPVKKV